MSTKMTGQTYCKSADQLYRSDTESVVPWVTMVDHYPAFLYEDEQGPREGADDMANTRRILKEFCRRKL